MDLSSDLYNDIQQNGAPKSGVLSAETADAMQSHDAAIKALGETNVQLESLNDNVCLLIDRISPTTDAITRLIKDVRFGVTPEAKTALTEQSKLIALKMASNVKIHLEHTTREISTTLSDNAAKAKANIVNAIRTETEQAAQLLKRTENSICLPQCTVYILVILLLFSLSFNMIIAAFNIHIWHNPTVTSLLVTFLLIAIGFITAIIAYFRWLRKHP